MAGPLPSVSQAGPHHGEEPVLSGSHGSGAIFLAGCNLHCVFCQNHDISCDGSSNGEDAKDLAETVLFLQATGCHNINFVTPSHHADVIAKSVKIARKRGLKIPVVYNCGGYESRDTLHLLENVVDIYMPDVKFFDKDACKRYLNTPDYGNVVKEALKIMQQQVGDLVMEDGLAIRGLLIRHLVMPGFVEDSKAILEFIAKEVSPFAYVNVMAQYWPTKGVSDFPELKQSPTNKEVKAVKEIALNLGLRLCN